LKWKIIGGLAGGIALFGLLALVVLNYQMSRLLRIQLERRASDIATNLGDGAATPILRDGVLDLYALVTKYSLLPGMAYALVRDSSGNVLAHSPGAPPTAFHESPALDGRRQPHQREFALQGRTVYESSVPILEGQAGSVSVGIWVDSVEAGIQPAVLSLVGLLVGALMAGLIFAVLLTRGIARRALRLKEMSARVSMGELETPVAIESNDEIGDIACSVERMRASLKAAMSRLSRT
jgi:HAMP domain-containing protein